MMTDIETRHISPTDPLPAARALATLPGMRAVALGGSLASGRADAESDADLYAFADAPPPEDARRAAVEARAAPGTVSLGEDWFGLTDEWTEPDGLHVEAMHFGCDWIEDQVAARMDRHEPAVGYSTAFVHTIAAARVMADPEGWFAALQARARAPYPEALARNVVRHNLPLLGGAHASFRSQLETAIRRDDAVSANHRAAAILASFWDVAFAAHRRLHPGEKRLLAHAETLERVTPGARDAARALAERPMEGAGAARRLEDAALGMAAGLV